jgi:hypothetical protein
MSAADANNLCKQGVVGSSPTSSTQVAAGQGIFGEIVAAFPALL